MRRFPPLRELAFRDQGSGDNTAVTTVYRAPALEPNYFLLLHVAHLRAHLQKRT